MKYSPDERFEGHLAMEDPRSNLFGAGCCTWPTVPAYRYICGSSNATGVFSGLLTQGLLFVFNGVQPAHNVCSYLMASGPPPILTAFLWKRYIRPNPYYEWEISMNVTGCSGFPGKVVRFDCGPCNVDFLIGEISCSGLPGTTGSDFHARQVEWDKSNSPNPWPPTP